jgi:alpha-D-xyloside xylohydrolase
VLVREGSVVPHIKLAQSTGFMDWSELELRVYADSAAQASGKVCLPSDDLLKEIRLTAHNGQFVLADDPFQGKIKFKITH